MYARDGQDISIVAAQPRPQALVAQPLSARTGPPAPARPRRGGHRNQRSRGGATARLPVDTAGRSNDATSRCHKRHRRWSRGSLPPGGQAMAAAMGRDRPGVRRVPSPAMTSSPTPTSPPPGPSPCIPRPSRSGPGSPSSGRGRAASTATTRWRTWSAATSTVPTRSSPNGKRSPSGTRSSSTRRSGSTVAALERGRSLVLRGGVPIGNNLASLRLHLGLRAPGAAGRDDTAAGPRTLRLHPAVGAVPRRARCRGQRS